MPDKHRQRVTRGEDLPPEAGDKPVDSVDNIPPVRGREPDIAGRPDAGDSTTCSTTDEEDAALSGVDLAREALRAAQAESAARVGKRPRGSGSASANLVRRKRRRRWSASGSDERDPQPLGRLAARIAAEHGWNERLAGGQVFARWAELVGSDVAEHTRPIELRDGELTVQADSTAWATQLRLLQRQLIAMIAKGIGHGVVKRMRIAGPSAPSWQHGPLHVRGRGPRDTYG